MKISWTELARDRLAAGRIVPEDEEHTRRELIHEGYRILYRVERVTRTISNSGIKLAFSVPDTPT